MTPLRKPMKPRTTARATRIIDLDCKWCDGLGLVPSEDDATFLVDCLCVTKYYPQTEKQPKLPGMTNWDLEERKPCVECRGVGFHKMSCSQPGTFSSIWDTSGFSSGY